MNHRINGRNELRKTKSEFWDKGFIIAYITLKPLYFFSSGVPQISDYLLAFYALIILIRLRGVMYFGGRIAEIVLGLAGLITYQGIINLAWSATLGENLSSKTIFYVFNGIVFSLTILLYNELGIKKLKRAIISGCLLSAIIAFIGVLFDGLSVRNTGFFNNPNQLGYHGVLLVSLLFLCIEESRAWETISISILSVWLVIASASKAGLISVFLLVALFLMFGSLSTQRKTIMVQLLLLVIVFLVVYMLLFSNNVRMLSNERILFMRNRLFNMQAEGDSSLNEGRGYDRIAEMGLNFLWGMGEGGYHRFQIMNGAEAHSTYASIIVSYGLIGAVVYLVFVFSVIMSRDRKSTINNIATMSGILLYGVSHNGIRNTLLWLFLGVMLVSNQERIPQAAITEGDKEQ